ncbi:uncharacterized protein [Elaeis guineensis]|uniref:Uncharacterized protein LOC105059005 isoform X2 n=1 Tax=Elaeis guineensis var. tenera TaxID=51953 RepID=A0A6I9SBI9_ELAGV|nr:uncharacterized protein LOC105059005 isoform X2 [Elaeis guineensis]
MLPKEWTPPCGSLCTKKYANLVQIPWRVFCKKGCDTDGETWEECLGECKKICYKDPVFKDHQWSAYIDRSPGDDNYSLFDIPNDKVEQVRPNRPPKQTTVSKPKPAVPDVKPTPTTDDLPCTSA